MKEAIGGTWLFQIVIFFILLFTGFMCLSINRSKAFNVKNFILETIQSHNGEISSESDAMKEIVAYMKENSYRTTGTKQNEIKSMCGKKSEYICYNREGKKDNNNPVFCIAKLSVDNNENGCLDAPFTELPNMYYYRIEVFYQLDLPFLHDLFGFKITGDTKVFYTKNEGVKR